MVDVHSHLIYNVDDGSRSIEESIKMLNEAYEAGFTDIFLTSHFMLGNYETVPTDLIERKNNLQEELEGKLKLHSGMEIYITEQLPELAKNKRVIPLGNSRYMLMELPLSSTVLYVDFVVNGLISQGITPVLAHPERYLCVQKDVNKILEFKDKGMIIQSNYSSILGLYGANAKKAVKTMLKNGWVDLLGSDCHRPGTIYKTLPKAIKKITKIIGEDEFYEISTVNPMKIINNQEFWD